MDHGPQRDSILRRPWSLLLRLFLVRLVLRLVFHHVLTVSTPIGRKARRPPTPARPAEHLATATAGPAREQAAEETRAG